MPRRLPLILVGFALAAVACGGATPAPAPTDQTVSAPDSLPTLGSAPSATDPLPPATTPAPPASEPPDALMAQILELMDATSQIRGLSFLRRPDISILTAEEMAARVAADLEEELDQEEFAVSDGLYTLLGLLPADVDLLELFIELQSEQTVAFYDTDTRELVTPATGEEFTPTERLTLVHELTHALTDQYFDLGSVIEELDEEERFDEASAFRALVEGDAMVTEFVYLQDLPRAELLEVLDDALSIDTPVFDESPKFLQDVLLFPYIQGQEFVAEIWAAEGFGAVDDVYRSRPVTTEHIYEPDSYVRGEPAEAVDAPAVTVAGYDVFESSTWGYLGFQTMFDQVLAADVSARAADGWGGDSYEILWDGSNVVFVLSYVGESEQDAIELHDALIQFVTLSMDVGTRMADGQGSSFEGDDYAFVSRVGDEVVFVAAHVPDAGRSARAVFTGF
jgi:hypothetical protein